VVAAREQVAKFKKGSENILEKVIVSLEKVGNSQHYSLYVRLANKVIHFTGTIFPGLTEVVKIKDN
jgi:uncharacterized protein (UPF0305 family)